MLRDCRTTVTKTEKPLKTSLVWVQVFLSQWALTFAWSPENSVKFWDSKWWQCVVVTAWEQSTWEWWFSCVSLFESFRREVKFYNPSFIDFLNLTCIFMYSFSYVVICWAIWNWKFMDNFAGSLLIEKKSELKSTILAAYHFKSQDTLNSVLKRCSIFLGWLLN